jgi:hypothetical protein
MTDKPFDCVEMKRRGAEEVQRQIAGLTREEELEFWRKQTDKLRERQTRARAQGKALAQHK